MEKNITLRDFSGGLNTAVDEASLDPNQTADMLNVDIMESKGMRRRRGYVNLSDSAIRTNNITHLSRQYRTVGSRLWVARCGTAVFTAGDQSVTEVIEAETLTTSPTMGNSPVFSGGSAVRITATQNFAIPPSSTMKIRVYGAASGRTDGGAWGSTSGGYYSYSNMTATAHTVSLRVPDTRNTTAMKAQSDGAKDIVSLSSTGADHSIAYNDPTERRIGIHFYDDYSSTKKPRTYISLMPSTMAASHPWLTRNATPRASCAFVVCKDDNYHQQTGSQATGYTAFASRSAGWHGVEFLVKYINGQTRIRTIFDGVDAGETYITATEDFQLHCETYGDGYSGTALWIDNFTYDIELKNDYGSTTGYTDQTVRDTGSAWVGVAGTHISTSTTHAYTSRIAAYADVVEYKIAGTFVRFAALSASSTTLAAEAYNNEVFFGSPHTALRAFNGATVADITASGAAPPAAYLARYKSRLFAAGKASDPALLEYTAVDAPKNWSGGGALSVVPKDGGGECTGLTVFNKALWWFSPSRIHSITFSGNTPSNEEVTAKYGCIAGGSLAVSPNAMVFLAGDGVRSYGLIPGVNSPDGSGFTLLSKDIAPTIERINKSALSKVVGEIFDNHYYLSVPLDDATENTHTLVFSFGSDKRSPSWTIYDYGTSVLCAPRGDEGGLYGSVNGTPGWLHQLEVGTVDAAGYADPKPIRMYYRTPPLTPDGYASIKHYRRLYLAAEATTSQTLTVTPYTDDVAAPAVSFTVTDESGVRPLRSPLNARGRSLGLEFESSGSNQELTISEVTLTYVPPSMR
jgi:hypothetical protein